MKATRLQGAVMAGGRVLLASIFVLSGLSKIGAPEATQAYMQAVGVPVALLWPTIAFELGLGLLIIIGYQTRLAAVLLAGFSLMAGIIFHRNFSDQIQMIMFLKNVSMAGGFLVLAAAGPGPISFDKRLR
ncbi:MAG: DoxX family protein [Rhodomicrobium sp.]